MPKRYQFNECKNVDNVNLAYNSVAGCNYRSRANEFKPHNAKNRTYESSDKKTVTPSITSSKPILFSDKPNKLKKPDKSSTTITISPVLSTTYQAPIVIDQAPIVIDEKPVVTNKPETKKEKPSTDNTEPKKEKKTKEEKKKRDDQSSGKAATVRRPPKPTLEDISPEVIDKARMVKASRLVYEEDIVTAQAYLDKNEIKLTIDESLSTNESIVLVEENGNAKIAYRGTKIENVSDITADALIAGGHDTKHPQFKRAKQQLAMAKENYNVTELIGYSLGGNKAIHLGNQNNIKATTFNPFLGKKLIKESVAADKMTTHDIFRTTEDFATVGLAWIKKRNFNVQSILPHKDRINPIEAHELENFSEISTRRPGFTQERSRNFQKQVQKAGDLMTIDEMVKSIEEGKTYTEHIHKFNSKPDSEGNLVDTTEDGQSLKGARMTKDTTHHKFWTEVSEAMEVTTPPFTEAELQHFEENPKVPEAQDRVPAITKQEIKEFVESPDRPAAIQQQSEVANTAYDEILKQTEALSAAERASQNIYEASESSHTNTLKRAANPVNLATGYAGGLAANKLMNKLEDAGLELNEPTRAVVEGGVSGVTTEVATQALQRGASSTAEALQLERYAQKYAPQVTRAATNAARSVGAAVGTEAAETAAGGLAVGGASVSLGALGAAAVGGAVAYGTAYVTQKYVTQGLLELGVNETVSEGIGTTTAGIAAGAAGVAATGATLAVLGLEVGAVFGPAGMAAGAAIGGIISLSIFLGGLWHHEHEPTQEELDEQRMQEFRERHEAFLELPESEKLPILMQQAYTQMSFQPEARQGEDGRFYIVQRDVDLTDYLFIVHRDSQGVMIGGEWKNMVQLQEEQEALTEYNREVDAENQASFYLERMEKLLEQEANDEELFGTDREELDLFKSSVETNTHADFARIEGKSITYGGGIHESHPKYEEVHERSQELYQEYYGELPPPPAVEVTVTGTDEDTVRVGA